MIHPSTIQMLDPQTGTGDMGDVTDRASVARFALPGAQRFMLAVVRMLFTGGSGSAELFVRTDHRHGPAFDFKPVRFAGMGTSSNDRLEYRVPEDELFHHLYLTDDSTGAQDSIAIEWANPDAGNMRWSVEVGLIDVSSIR